LKSIKVNGLNVIAAHIPTTVSGTWLPFITLITDDFEYIEINPYEFEEETFSSGIIKLVGGELEEAVASLASKLNS
jgi:hypothetical protein